MSATNVEKRRTWWRSLTRDVSPLTPEQQARAREIDFRTIARIYRTSPILIPCVAAVLLFTMDTQYAPTITITWYACLCLGYVVVAICQEGFFRATDPGQTVDKWIHAYSAIYWVVNFIWGSHVLVFWSPENQVQNMALLMILIAHAATVTGISYRILSVLYSNVVPVAIMIIVGFALGGTLIHLSIGICSILYFVFIYFSTKTAHAQNLEMFAIRFRNEQLVEDLAREKESLDLAHERLGRANLDLHEREDLFRALVENAFEGIFLTGEDGNIRYTTPSIKQLGFEACNVIGKPIAEVLRASANEEKLQTAIHKVEVGGQTQTIEMPMERTNGTSAWIEMSITNLGTGASAQGLVFNIRDITERKQADEEMQAHLDILDALATGAPLETILRDVTDSIDRTSPNAHAAIFLTDSEKRVTRAVSQSVPSSLLEAIDGIVFGPTIGCCGAALQAGHRVIVEDTEENPLSRPMREHLRAAGYGSSWAQPIYSRTGHILGTVTTFYETMRAPTDDEIAFASGAAHLAGIAIDRRQSEKQLREASQNAEMANRAKSRFLATMSHELRTPLNAIIGFSEVMHKEMFGKLGSDRYRDYMSDILTSGRHLLSMIDDILDLSKIEAGRYDLELKDIDIMEVVDWSAELVRPKLMEGGLKLKINTAPNLPLVHADRRSLRQVLLNLLSNAIKFTHAGGSISVDIALQGEQMEVAVTDTGIGIPADRLKETLEPFVQVESSLTGKHHGTGLGLAITKTLVEMHEGTFNIESEENVGTRVSFVFPTSRLVARETDAA
ncbi:MAG: ATP-binding protein [Parvibaculum sp.]